MTGSVSSRRPPDLGARAVGQRGQLPNVVGKLIARRLVRPFGSLRARAVIVIPTSAKPGSATVGSLLRRRPSIVYDDCTLRDAADHMVNHDIGRLPVVKRERPGEVVGMITRSDLLGAHRKRLTESTEAVAHLRWRRSA